MHDIDNMHDIAYMHDIAKRIMDNNVVLDKLKVSHSLFSGGTFVVYIVHPPLLFSGFEQNNL